MNALTKAKDALNRAQSALWAVEIAAKRGGMPKTEAHFHAEYLAKLRAAAALIKGLLPADTQREGL